MSEAIAVKLDMSVNRTESIYNGLNTMCVWNVLQYDNEHVGNEPDGFIKKLYPQLEYLILMTFTGGRAYNNWYSEDENGNASYHFEKPVEIIRNVIRGGVRPFIVIGQTPFELSTHPEDRGEPGTDWGNRYLPKDWNRYYDYIKAFAHTLVNNFGTEEIRNWKFRLMTEWDDCLDVQYWWKETVEGYFMLYDYTFAALSSEIGEENLFYGPGNVMKIDRLDRILGHCAYGTNYFSGKLGSRCDHISASAYFQSVDIERIAELSQKLWDKAKRYPTLGIRETGFGEAGFSHDVTGQRLHMAQGITEDYGSAVARILDLTGRENKVYFANWEYLTDRSNYDMKDWKLHDDKPYLRTPAANVAECASRLVGSEKMEVEISGCASNANSIGVIAGWQKHGNCLKILIYNHNSLTGDQGEEAVDLKICGIRPGGTGKLMMKHWRIDHDHCNFSPAWLSYSNDLQRKVIEFDMGTKGNSSIDTPVFLYLDEQGKKLYDEKKEHYRELGRLQEYEPEMIQETMDGEAALRISMTHHSVSYLEIYL